MVPSDVLVELARLYHVSTDYLMGLDDHRNMASEMEYIAPGILKIAKNVQDDNQARKLLLAAKIFFLNPLSYPD